MSGAACKVLENNGRQAVTEGLERILIEPELNGGLIPDKERRGMLQALADIDAVCMHGGTIFPSGSLVGIMKRLEALGVLSADVWRIYAKELPAQEQAQIEPTTTSGGIHDLGIGSLLPGD